MPTPPPSATVDPKLLELLVCPLTKGRLTFDAENGELICEASGLAYPVRDGIPIMLPSEARRFGNDEAQGTREDTSREDGPDGA